MTEITKTVETTRVDGYICDICDTQLERETRARIILETPEHWHESDFCTSCYKKIEAFIESLGGKVHQKW